MIFYKKYLPLLYLNHSKYDFIILTGGRGSMKTGHCLRGVLKCAGEESKRVCFFRETKDTLDFRNLQEPVLRFRCLDLERFLWKVL